MSLQSLIQTKAESYFTPVQTGLLQRKCAACGQRTIAGGECEGCQKKRSTLSRPASLLPLQRRAANQAEPAEVPPIVGEVLRSPGWPLDSSTRQFMESRFEHDFSGVRVHTDAKAARSAQAVNALAYTVGSHVVFGEGHYQPHVGEGQKLLAHELTHVVQQRVQTQANLSTLTIGEPSSDLEHEAEHVATNVDAVQTSAISPSLVQLQGQFLAPPPQSGGFRGAMERDRRRTYSAPRNLHFYHGTSWNIARTIIGNVRPEGGGDFAAGFYTHFDRDNSRAMDRARRWGVITALRQRPPEQYAGVIDFEVRSDDFHHLLGSSRSLDFNLYSRDQSDYQERQREWLDFITSHGREAEPTFRPNRRGSGGKWAHERRAPQPHLGYNIITGPFYRPIRGTADRVPERNEFQPYAEGRDLPQQVAWANDGIRLLNSSRVNTRLYQFDANTGEPVDPPQDAFTPATPIPTRDVDVLLEV